MSFLSNIGLQKVILPVVVGGITTAVNWAFKHVLKDENSNGIPDAIEKLPSVIRQILIPVLVAVKENLCSYAIDKTDEDLSDEQKQALGESVAKGIGDAINEALVNVPKEI